MEDSNSTLDEERKHILPSENLFENEVRDIFKCSNLFLKSNRRNQRAL
jgi:hypothetical protein